MERHDVTIDGKHGEAVPYGKMMKVFWDDGGISFFTPAKQEFSLTKMVHYPSNHQPGMRVPKGGSSCSTCKFLGPGNTCKNKYFIEYHGSNKLPFPADEFCSDWYEWKK